MARQEIDIGTSPNDGTGDPARDAFDKTNDNFAELYSQISPEESDITPAGWWTGLPGWLIGIVDGERSFFVRPNGQATFGRSAFGAGGPAQMIGSLGYDHGNIPIVQYIAQGRNSAVVAYTFGRLDYTVDDNIQGSEDGHWDFWTSIGGSLVNTLRIADHLSLLDNPLKRFRAQDYAEVFAAQSGSGAMSIDLEDGNTHVLTLTGDMTGNLTIANALASTGTKVKLEVHFVGSGASRAIVHPSAVDWGDGTAPASVGDGNRTVVIYEKFQGVTNWLAYVAGTGFTS
jgi:hypothetical protein